MVDGLIPRPPLQGTYQRCTTPEEIETQAEIDAAGGLVAWFDGLPDVQAIGPVAPKATLKQASNRSRRRSRELFTT
jgi:hypothetical protein